MHHLQALCCLHLRYFLHHVDWGVVGTYFAKSSKLEELVGTHY